MTMTAKAAYNRAWKAANPERVKETQRKYKEANREQINSRQRARRAADPDRKKRDREYMRVWRYRGRFGVPRADLDAMRATQQNRCAICDCELSDANLDTRATVSARTAVVDHYDTEDGPIVRGILCSRCNMGIGQLDHSPERLRAAAEYLEKSR